MTKDEALKGAKEIAEKDKIKMAVTFNPYAEEEREEDKFSFFPHASLQIFLYEELITTVEPG